MHHPEQLGGIQAMLERMKAKREAAFFKNAQLHRTAVQDEGMEGGAQLQVE